MGGRKRDEINPSKCKAVHFTRARVKDPLHYTLGDQLIPEASRCKYLGITLRSDLNRTDHVNYTVKKAWKALHFIMRILKKGNSRIVVRFLNMVLRVGIRTGRDKFTR
jgi:hypothetical protein